MIILIFFLKIYGNYYFNLLIIIKRFKFYFNILTLFIMFLYFTFQRIECFSIKIFIFKM